MDCGILVFPPLVHKSDMADKWRGACRAEKRRCEWSSLGRIRAESAESGYPRREFCNQSFIHLEHLAFNWEILFSFFEECLLLSIAVGEQLAVVGEFDDLTGIVLWIAAIIIFVESLIPNISDSFFQMFSFKNSGLLQFPLFFRNKPRCKIGWIFGKTLVFGR